MQLRKLAIGLFCAVFGLAVAASTAQAASLTILENYTGDTQGNYAPLNFYDVNHGYGDSTAGIHVELRIPNPTGTSRDITLDEISLQLHDHDESLEMILDVYSKGKLIQRVANYTDVRTSGSDLSCGGGGGFVKLRHDHHLPQNEGSDSGCMTTQTFAVGKVADGVLLTFHCRTAYCRNNPDVHMHLGQITWKITVPDEPPITIPTPSVQTLGCVDTTATSQTANLLNVSWGQPAVPIQNVSITDSTDANRWDRRYGRFWTKNLTGGTSTTGPTGFAPQTAQTTPLIFRPNTPYFVVLWNGTHLSTQVEARFTACPVIPQPATASMNAQCSTRQAGTPLSFSGQLTSIDLKGNTFTKATYYLRIKREASTAALRAFLGRPTRDDGTFVSYWIDQSLAAPTNNTLNFTWNSAQAIGSSQGNQKTLVDLETWVMAKNAAQQFTISALIETRTAGGSSLESYPAASSTVIVSDTACASGACVPVCGACAVANSPSNCPGVSCPAGTSVGVPNPVQILTPAAGAQITLNANSSFNLTWRQEPTTGANTQFVSAYRGVIYPDGAYSDPDEALDAYTSGSASNVISFNQPAARTLPATIYSKNVILTSEFLNGPLTIAIKSLNQQCPAQNSASIWTTNTNEPTATLSGGFFLNTTNSCSNTSTPLDVSGASVTANKVPGGAVAVNTTSRGFSADITPGASIYNLKLSYTSGGGTGLRCSTSCNPESGGGCVLSDVAAPTNSANFFLESYNVSHTEGWWQSFGGLIYGHAGISSNLPLDGSNNIEAECRNAPVGYCEPFISRRLDPAEPLTAGLPITNGSIPARINGWMSERLTQISAQGSDNLNKIKKENYAYFSSRFAAQLTANNVLDRIASLSDLPTGTITDGVSVAYRDGDLIIDPDSTENTWQVPAGEKRIIFVNGSLTIRQNNSNPVIDVVQGGYLAFIVKDSILIDPTVGHENPTATNPNTSIEPNISGIFIADNKIVVQKKATGDDKKFVGAGTFVGWQGVELERTFSDGDLGAYRHVTTPTETFIFRPDFLVNTPPAMRHTDLVWQEIR